MNFNLAVDIAYRLCQEFPEMDDINVHRMIQIIEEVLDDNDNEGGKLALI